MERRTAEGMLSSSGCLHILLEHFNFEQQPLLDAYAMGRIDMAGLAAAYEEGGEGHDVAAYEPLLRLAREQPAPIHRHAGFIPRSYARIVMRESTAAALEAARARLRGRRRALRRHRARITTSSNRCSPAAARTAARRRPTSSGRCSQPK